ncbi:hypothetical protein CN326_17420 [Bacillus sp. AFS018417]|uniref:hypothetical protein n=1 Tax=Bacillus sp. AFS018417 TaxID=2033491 RepID=UPI000BF68769|nr:hypothetical protein [Bacillus sp. AFS018417]PEZ03986.1 hypothetical protein CN326_17420 [Bacillus sp. AFS018417]
MSFLQKNRIYMVRIMICLSFFVIAAVLSQGAVIMQEKFIHPKKKMDDEEERSSIYFTKEPGREIEEMDEKEVKGITTDWNFGKIRGLKGVFEKSPVGYSTIGGLALGSIVVTYFVRRKTKKRKTLSLLMKKDIKCIENEKESCDNVEKFTILPEEEIRVFLIEWEKTLPQYEKRRPFETIQRWLSRIKRGDEIISIYEQVRYGRKISSSEEIHRLKKWTEEN